MSSNNNTSCYLWTDRYEWNPHGTRLAIQRNFPTLRQDPRFERNARQIISSSFSQKALKQEDPCLSFSWIKSRGNIFLSLTRKERRTQSDSIYTCCTWAGGTMELSRTIDRICWSCFFVLCFMSHCSHLLFLRGVEVYCTSTYTHVEIYICGLFYT